MEGNEGRVPNAGKLVADSVNVTVRARDLERAVSAAISLTDSVVLTIRGSVEEMRDVFARLPNLKGNFGAVSARVTVSGRTKP